MQVGEATETALVVLVEKLNVYGTSKGGLSPRDLGHAANRVIQQVRRPPSTRNFDVSAGLLV